MNHEIIHDSQARRRDVHAHRRSRTAGRNEHQQDRKKLLRKALGIANESVAERRKRFEKFHGTWTEEQAAEFEEAVRVFDEIDQDSWQ